MGLALYKQKRNFKETPEPVQSTKGKGPKLTFVVQRHDASHLHYDFRLEMEGVLKSWAVPKGPSMKAGERRLAVMVEDHPLSYGKFYGEIPKGNYGAGTVDIWDHGTYKPVSEKKITDEEKHLLAGLKKGHLVFEIRGQYLKGVFSLVRLNDEQEKNWLLIKKKDEFSEASFNIAKIDPVKAFQSKKAKAPAASKAASKPVAAKKEKVKTAPVKKLSAVWEELRKPMLAKLATEVHDDPEWIFEPKYDGYRAVTKISQGKVEMMSRNGKSFNKQYSSLVKELEKIEQDVVLDGEVVIEDKKGVSNFQLLQNYITTQEGTLTYYVFDILFLNGFRITGLPLEQRKELLDTLFTGYKFKQIKLSPITKEKGSKLMKSLTAKGYEGVIGKANDSLYYPGKRSDSWLKFKSVMMQEVVICGYTLPQNSRKFFGSLMLGVYENKQLVYIGNCGTGFTEASLEELHAQLKKLETKVCPFDTKPVMRGEKGKPVWVKPVLVCNVKFQQWTQDRLLRVPVFMGLRNDKKATEVIDETSPRTTRAGTKTVATKEHDTGIEKSEKSSLRTKVKLTNLTKVYWPEDGITKGDLINYYNRIGKYILPYLKNRPESLNRFPNGIKGDSFYQKDMEVSQLPDWIKTAKIYSKSTKKYIDYLLCNNLDSLLYMANLGCIEINPWHSKYNKPDHPDYMMMDLDPGDISFSKVVDTALAVKEICDELDIPCYCKTSGATGLHIYIPLGAKYHYDEVKTFAELLATLTHQRLPKITSIERSVAKRTKKVYVDFLQNRKGQTIAAPYSVRPRPHATVSAPLLWKEVKHSLSPQQFTIYNIEERIEKVGDLWEGVLKGGISIPKVLAKIERLIS